MKMFIEDLKHIFDLGFFHKRTWRFFFQYLVHGWSDQDTWAMDYYVARKIQPVLKRCVRIQKNCLLLTNEDIKQLDIIIKTCDEFIAEQVFEDEFHKKVLMNLINMWW